MKVKAASLQCWRFGGLRRVTPKTATFRVPRRAVAALVDAVARASLADALLVPTVLYLDYLRGVYGRRRLSVQILRRVAREKGPDAAKRRPQARACRRLVVLRAALACLGLGCDAARERREGRH